MAACYMATMWWWRRVKTDSSSRRSGPRTPTCPPRCESARRRKLCGVKCGPAICCDRTSAIGEMFFQLEEGRFVKMITEECNESACDKDDHRPADDSKYLAVEGGIDEDPY